MKDKHQRTYELPTSSEDKTGAERVNGVQLQRLVHLLDESDVSEIEVNRTDIGMHLVLRKAKASENAVSGAYPQVVSPSDSGSSIPAAAAVDTKKIVPAPLVGIFHTWAKPRGKSLVAPGDRIKVGQVVGTIQSLNVLIEVESPVAGTLVEIQVQDGQAVEYGQPLMLVDPTEEG